MESCGYKQIECASKRCAPVKIGVLIVSTKGVFYKQTGQAVRGWCDY